MRLSHAASLSFKHNDLLDLEAKLKKAKGHIVVITESVFSMDGDLAPLTELLDLCAKYHAELIVDEAHGTGIFGENGEGVCVTQNLESRIFARLHTFGKATGAIGAVVCGSKVLKDHLINNARSFIFTTAMSEPHIHEVREKLEAMGNATDERRALQNNITFFKEKIAQLDLVSGFEKRNGAIQIFPVKGNEEAKKISTELEVRGMYVKAILSPTVPAGTERLRICLHSYNTTQQIEALLKALKELNV
jgi:8-amino-7-oxononanoate synthase